jgi:hypothetical protein
MQIWGGVYIGKKELGIGVKGRGEYWVRSYGKKSVLNINVDKQGINELTKSKDGEDVSFN